VLALARLYRGTHQNGTTIVTRRGRDIEIELERELPIQLDGEVARAERLVVSVRPSALVVLAAPDAAAPASAPHGG
jgi:diacylglycerol kinase family enzyme